jgi:hypothetical protein
MFKILLKIDFNGVFCDFGRAEFRRGSDTSSTTRILEFCVTV